MNLGKRVQRIETSVTPKQAVLLWLDEMLQLGLLGYMEREFKRPMHEAPRTRLTQMVGRAVREGLCNQGMKWELAVNAVRDAQIRTDFLIILIRNLQREVQLECMLNAPYVMLLFEKFKSMLEDLTEHDRFDTEMWELWRAILIQRFCGMRRSRELVFAVSNKYFDRHPLLFREDADTLNEQIQCFEKFIKYYNRLKTELPDWRVIDLDSLASSILKYLPDEVEKRVADAQATTLADFGESEAAWKTIEPYATAALQRLRTKSGARATS
ncbi:MAG TPA: hypothetical protein VFO39_22995 [Candidatus Sulfotelmatobacter sp.]|nr:hypothetical protein [Candidatus Sulfotelmatobacter sp.]